MKKAGYADVPVTRACLLVSGLLRAGQVRNESVTADPGTVLILQPQQYLGSFQVPYTGDPSDWDLVG